MENSELITIITEDDEVYQFEGIVSYTGNDTSTLTSYPTSEGTPRTDNIYNNPNKFTCSISIGGNENITDEWGSGTDRPKSAMSILTKWKEDAVALTIITNQKDYYNMFLTGISPQSTNQNSYDLAAGLSFDELRIVNFTLTTIQVTNPIDISYYGSADTSNENGVSDNMWNEIWKNTSELGIDVAEFGLIGAGIGSVVPGVGTAIGGVLGVGAGCIKYICGKIPSLFK